MNKNTPTESVDTMISSLAPSTLKQYNSALHQWWNFCSEKEIELFTGNISVVLEFLQSCFDTGASYTSLNTIRSALSLILPTNNNLSVGEDEKVKRWMKAVFRARPQTPKYQSVWDPKPVIVWLGSISPIESVSLEMLTLKLVGLLALATAQRVQTLTLMELSNISISDQGISINITKLIKTSAPGRKQPCLFLPYFIENPELCVATTLIEYLKRTREHRPQSCEQVLISFRRPYKAVSSQTVSRWIKLVLKQSGIDVSVFTAHSTRHASTSKAAANGANIEVIRDAAGWTTASSTFQRFYNRPTQDRAEFCATVFS